MILLFLGAPRTATTSLWTVLSKHKDITGSKLKEPLNKSPKKLLFPRCYFDEFYHKENAKFFLDGTPCAYNYYSELVKKLEIDIKIIYPVRNPYDRLYSSVKQIILTHAAGFWIGHKKNPLIIDKFKIDKSKLFNFILHKKDSINIECAYNVTNDVLITRWDRMIRTKCIEIFDFLEIEPMDIEIPRTNSMDLWYTKSYCRKVKEDVDNFFIEERSKINKMILDDLRKIQHKVYVEDWINENINNT